MSVSGSILIQHSKLSGGKVFVSSVLHKREKAIFLLIKVPMTNGYEYFISQRK